MSEVSGWAQKENSEDNQGLVIVSMTEVATAYRAAWHTWCCSHSAGGGWRSAVEGLLRGNKSEPGKTLRRATRSVPCVFPHLKVFLHLIWAVENTRSILFKSFLSQHTLMTKREIPRKGRWSTARLTRMDRHFIPSSNFESLFHLTSGFFIWKVQESNQLCVAVKQQHYNSICRATIWETLLFVLLFALIATTTA